MKLEYRVLAIHDPSSTELEEMLNGLGAEEWELVAVNIDTETETWVGTFKRPAPLDPYPTTTDNQEEPIVVKPTPMTVMRRKFRG